MGVGHLLIIAICLFNFQTALSQAPRCTGGRVWTNCGTCDRTCETESIGGVMCAAVCQRKCQCPRDRPIWHSGRCIQQNQCSGSTPRCTGGRVWTNCGTCDRTCETEFSGGVMCLAVCRRKCQCPRDRPIWHSGRCIQQYQCPGPGSTCSGGRVFKGCGSACTPTCNHPYTLCTRQCVPRCECPRSLPLWHRGRCVPRQECPSYLRRN